MNILVTGASGFIGSHLCRELVRKKHRVAGLTRSGRTEYITSLLTNETFSLHTGDVNDTELIQQIIEENGIKTVFHLAAKLPNKDDMSNPLSSFDINARGTASVANAAASKNVGKYIYISTMSVYSEPPSYLPVDEEHPAQPHTIYGITKRIGELCCNLYDKRMTVIILRYAGVYGKYCRASDAVPTFVRQALNNQPLTIDGDGAQSSDFVHIDDIIEGSILAWEKGEPGIYNLGSGQEVSVRELAEKVINLTGSKSEIMKTTNRSDRPYRFVMDITKARKLPGYSPQSIDEGLCHYLANLGHNR